jgi:biotin-(acetyl-CoA carboxylase) ligase
MKISIKFRECSIVGVGLNMRSNRLSILHTKLSLTQITGKNYILEELLIDFLETLSQELQQGSWLYSRYDLSLQIPPAKQEI